MGVLSYILEELIMQETSYLEKFIVNIVTSTYHMVSKKIKSRTSAFFHHIDILKRTKKFGPHLPLVKLYVGDVQNFCDLLRISELYNRALH
jgi:hypothetical protein